MADFDTFPGVGSLNHDNPKTVVEPGLFNDRLSLCSIDSSYDFDPQLERIVQWKRDLLLVPLFGVLHTIMFLDRTNIANARIEGLEKGLDMPSHGYNNCLWIFYIPFVIAEIPSNLFLTLEHIRPRWFLGIQMLLLGV